jgi:hypothetical protein
VRQQFKKQLTFSKPAAFYVENFRNFPTGMAVPRGYYDRQRGVWVPQPNGRVVFSLGHSTLQMKSTFDGKIDWTTCTFKFTVHLTFTIRDMFKDPAEIFNWFKRDVELPGGTPYQMNADWSKDYSGGGKVK